MRGNDDLCKTDILLRVDEQASWSKEEGEGGRLWAIMLLKLVSNNKKSSQSELMQASTARLLCSSGGLTPTAGIEELIGFTKPLLVV